MKVIPTYVVWDELPITSDVWWIYMKSEVYNNKQTRFDINGITTNINKPDYWLYHNTIISTGCFVLNGLGLRLGLFEICFPNENLFGLHFF